MKSSYRAGAAALCAAAVCGLNVAAPAVANEFDPELTQCGMRYNLSGWSFFFKTMKGDGLISCDNGQSARVSLQTWAGGLTAGRSEIVGGMGTFTRVRDIDELIGIYAEMGAHAGVTASGAASVVTKGPVSLALSGTGNGVDIGVTLGGIRIKRATTPSE